PDNNLPRAVVAFWNDALEIGIFHWMVLRAHGEALLSRVHRRAFGYSPRHQDAADLQPKIVVQAAGVVLLHYEDRESWPAAVLATFGFGSFGELAFAPVFFKRHDCAPADGTRGRGRQRGRENLSRDRPVSDRRRCVW